MLSVSSVQSPLSCSLSSYSQVYSYIPNHRKKRSSSLLKMRAQTLIKNPFSAIAILVPLFPSLKRSERQMNSEVSPNTSVDEISQAELQQQMEEGKIIHVEATEEPEEKTRAMSTEVIQQNIKKEATRQAKLKVLVELASFEILIGCSALITIVFSRKDPHQSLRLAIFCFLAFLTLLTGIALLLHILFMMMTKTTLITQIHRTTSKVLLLISITSLILTSVTPVTLLPKPYYILPIIMVPVLVTLGFYFYLGTQTNNEEETDETRVCFIEHVNALTRLSELNQGLASLSSSGLIGILFGSWINALNHAHHPYAKASVICMFFSFICSLLLMFLCQVRVDGLTSKARVNLIRTIKAFCVFLFITTALAALTVSSYFLKGYIVGVLFPVLLAGIVGFCVEFCTPANDHDRCDYPEDKLKSIFTTASKVTTLSFGIIMGIFGAYLGSQETNMHLNISIFFSTCGFVSGIILMLLSYETPKKPASMGVLFSVLICCGIIFLAFGGLSVFFLVLMRL